MAGACQTNAERLRIKAAAKKDLASLFTSLKSQFGSPSQAKNDEEVASPAYGDSIKRGGPLIYDAPLEELTTTENTPHMALLEESPTNNKTALFDLRQMDYATLTGNVQPFLRLGQKQEGYSSSLRSDLFLTHLRQEQERYDHTTNNSSEKPKAERSPTSLRLELNSLQERLNVDQIRGRDEPVMLGVSAHTDHDWDMHTPDESGAFPPYGGERRAIKEVGHATGRWIYRATKKTPVFRQAYEFSDGAVKLIDRVNPFSCFGALPLETEVDLNFNQQGLSGGVYAGVKF